MQFTELKEIEPSLKVLFGNADAFDIKSISHSDAPLPETFIFIRSRKFLKEIGRRSKETSFLSSGLVIEKSVLKLLEEEEFLEVPQKFAWIAEIDNVSVAMTTLSKPFYQQKFDDLNFQVDGRKMGTAKIDASARISEGVFIGSHVEVGAHAVIMPGCVLLPHSKLGSDSIMFPNITLYPFCEVGQKCRIHAGTVLGSDGFGYHFHDGEHKKIWHLYPVIIEDEVEIGSNTNIDNGAFIETRIGFRSRIDNDVQISHNVFIGENVIICGKTGLAGSVEVGNYCAFGAQSGVAPSARLGIGVQVAARGAVSENARVPDGAKLGGHPARPIGEWLKAQAILRKLTIK